MPDIADNAQDHIERETAGLLAARKPAGPKADGRCHNCNSLVPPGLRWCDADCREDWERDQRAAKRGGE